MDRHGLYEGSGDLQEKVQEAIRDPEVQALMAQDPELSQYLGNLPKPNATPKVDPDFPNPDKPEQHADGLKLQGIADWVDRITKEEGFHIALQSIPVDISAMGWMANKRSREAMSDVPLDEPLDHPDGGTYTDPEEMERQRLVLQWLDAFVMGWKFHRDEGAIEAIEGNRRFFADNIPSPPPGPRPGVNRKQRRKKR